MRVQRVMRRQMYDSLHKRPQYNETAKKKSEEEEERQYRELKEKLEDFQSHLDKYRHEEKSNLYEKEGVDMEALRELFRRNE